MIGTFRLAGVFDDADDATLAITIQLTRHYIKDSMNRSESDE